MEDTRDSQQIVCKKCGVLKTRYKQGKRPGSKDSKYVGESGKEWNGRQCDSCQVEAARLRKREKAKPNA